MEELNTLAIKAALNHNWDEALRLNKKILAENPTDECLLRIAHAHYSQGDIKKALTAVKKALKIAPDNHLAQKLLDKCKNTKSLKARNSIGKVNLKAFVGTDINTKLIKLVHIGTPSVVASILPGESLKLEMSLNKAHVETLEGAYLGRLPDDMAAKIWTNREKHFDAVVRSAQPNVVSILLRETVAG